MYVLYIDKATGQWRKHRCRMSGNENFDNLDRAVSKCRWNAIFGETEAVVIDESAPGEDKTVAHWKYENGTVHKLKGPDCKYF